MAGRKSRLRTRLRKLAELPKDPEGRAKLKRAALREWKALSRPFRRTRLRVSLPEAEIPQGPVARPDVTAAVILDPFSALALGYEWNQIALQPGQWRTQLDLARPDLLFVESAWRGNAGAWAHAMTGTGETNEALRSLVAWCRAEGVPTVFWNKEDPPNYEKFIDTAKLFDVVFTVDADRIPQYLADLGHERVHLLPFAAQPRIHNPVRHDRGGKERPLDVAFAGTYFADKHPERREQMDYLLAAAEDYDLNIFSRLQNDDPQYRFPSRYSRRIVGSLPYERMLAAYTAYKVFLNVNSVTQSPTMCARRVFELSAAQTSILSGPAKSIPEFFGEDVTVVDNLEDAKQQLGNLLKHRELRDRQALRAHRRVFDHHLFTHRVDRVLREIGREAPQPCASISAVVPTMRPEQLPNVWAFMNRQVHPNTELVLVTHGFTPDPELVARLQDEHPLPAVTVAHADAELRLGELMNIGVEAASGDYIAKMDDDNYYAAHYLSDLVRAFSWTDAQVVGKWAHYVHIGDEEGPTLLRFADHEHRYTRLVQGGTILTPRQVAIDYRFEDLPRRVDTTFLDKIRADGGRVYSSDRFNFVSTRTSDASGHTWGVSTSHLLAHSSELQFFGPAEAQVTV